MQRRYLLWLVGLTTLLTIVAWGPMWTGQPWWRWEFSLIPLYFAAISATQHWLVTKAMYKSPKMFVQIFMGTVVGVLFIHLLAMSAYIFTHATIAKWFVLFFGVGYLVYLIFETIALVSFVNREKRRGNGTK